MKFEEFKVSARRHNRACRALREKLDSISPDSVDYKHMLVSLYYLTGYVIECVLKFKILEVSGHSEDECVGKDSCLSIGVNYNSDIKIHKLERLQEYLDSKISGVSYRGSSENVESLIREWDPVIRYKDIELNCDDVCELHDHINIFFRKL